MIEPTDPVGTILEQIERARMLEGKPYLTLNRYLLIKDADESSGGFFYGTYLAKHTRERDYEERKKYSSYFNYMRPILNARVNPVFERPIQRDGITDPLWDEFMKDCDRRGTSFERWVKDLARKAVRDRVVFIMMDTAVDPAPTLGDALDVGNYPYIYIREAMRVCYWKTDIFGNFTEIAFTEYDHVKQRIVYKRWDKDNWTVFGAYVNGTFADQISTGPTPGFMPIIPFYSTEHDAEDPMPMPDFYGIARTCLGIFNMTSEIRELQRGQGFSLLIYPARKIAQAVVIGIKNLLNFDPESKHEPKYISPDAAIQKNFESERNTYIIEIYRMAELMGVMGKTPGDASSQKGQGSQHSQSQSGTSKEWDFKATNSVLSDLAARCEGIEKKIAAMFGEFITQTLELEVRYPREYGLFDVNDELSRATTALQLAIGGKFDQAVKERLAKVLFPEMPKVELDALITDIEQTATDAATTAAAQAKADVAATKAKALPQPAAA